MSRADYSCPTCGTIVDGPPLRCPHCSWHLITLKAWKKLPPFSQGYALYMQSSWPTSEIAGESNPYTKGSDDWEKFRQGEARAVQDAQDGEE